MNVNVRVTHNASLEFPSVTVCNKNAFNDSKAYRFLLEKGVRPVINIPAYTEVLLFICSTKL